ncbi:unnamed protein product [Rotaria magnacalcarata]|uniref:Tetratricopeptide repeat protein n=2 Tax=Rotaria magnacalcarata TaxID=392030 RepID=A0A816AGN5_9BILA|nr:unnamed protein product [Rotaria magnacalcarata]CAF1595358.1 unnamed protein product [Rotaria magnacalcarata]CAF1958834.1 unnamed protein product [Rotaria magnacalcarata]CAF3926587.1 unnamed protein product [Rotaria magnacalcarata]CAF3938388.1 unnamed protein product [Rotaria magnacalcarata]
MDMEEENIESYSLIWFDSSSNNNDYKKKFEEKLRSSINFIKIFIDENEFLNYIEAISNDEKLILIINSKSAQHIISRIHQLEQILSIYFFSLNIRKHQIWTKLFYKIKCVVNDYDELICQILYDQKERFLNKIDETISITKINDSNKKDEDLLFNCLINIKVNLNDKNELITLLENNYRNNPTELLLIKEFHEEYLSSKSIWWLTRYCFISKIINKLIINKSFKMLFLMRFFFQDIYKEIQLNKSIDKSFRLYKSQLITKKQLESLKNSIGDEILINNFLFTYLIRKTSFSHLKNLNISENFHGILFEIDIDSNLNQDKYYSNINLLSYSANEQIILFMIGSIFKIINIEYYDNNISIIHMIYQNKNSIKRIENFDLIHFGYFLTDSNQYDQAFFYFNYLIQNFNENLYEYYNALANISLKQNQYDLSLKFYQKLIQLNNSKELSSIYNNIAFVYFKKIDFQQSLKYYQMNLNILKENFNENYPFIIESYNNIALIYKSDHKYENALEYYENILFIYDNYCLHKNSDKAISYYNIGLIYYYLKKFNLSLEYFNKSLDIYNEILPLKHYLISVIYENIANIYYDLNDVNQSFLYYQKANEIYQNLFSSKHPDVLQIKIIINRIKTKLNI